MSRALIVDDRAENRDLLGVLLRGHGWEVGEARHGAEALTLARQEVPDLVISDLLMPVMDGYTLLRQWKADPELAGIPFIVYTATYTDPRDEQLARDMGADAFIVKPAEPDAFLSSVNEVMALVHMGSAARPVSEMMDPSAHLEQYSATLVRKLEKKARELGEANRELGAREARYRQMFEANPNPMWVYDLEALRFLAVNDAAVAHYGYTRDEFLAMTIADIGPQENLPSLMAAVGTVDSGIIRDVLWRHRKRDGTLIDVEITSHALDFGGLKAEMVLAHDVTARLRAEAELRASEERFRELTETIREVFWVTDPVKNQVSYVSPAYEAIWGRPRETLYASSLSWVEAIHPDDRDRVLQEAATRQTQGSYDEEYRIVRPDGEVRWIRDTAYPVFGRDGSVERIVGVARDITGRKLAQLQFLQAQKLEAVGLLADGVAHDFNNLLTVILTEAELLGEDLGEDSPFQEAVLAIRRAGERASGLTRQLLAFSRRQLAEPRAFPLNDVVSEMGSMLRRLVGEQVDLVTRLAPGAGSVLADRGQVEQVVMNLAVNARDAMPRGGRLTLETGTVDLDEAREGLAAGSYVTLTVSDTGAGMTDEVRARVFEPFFTTKDPGKGTGLGLATSRGIAQQAGGDIVVESQPGAGTTMRVFLPRVADDEEGERGRDSTTDLPRGHETVLVVEDDENVRKVATRLLRSLGYKVLAAANGSEALRVVESSGETLHLLLTDVVMPDMSGREVAERVTAARCGIKVLYTSGYTDDTLLQTQLLEQRARLIPKPYSVEALARQVREALDH